MSFIRPFLKSASLAIVVLLTSSLAFGAITVQGVLKKPDNTNLANARVVVIPGNALGPGLGNANTDSNGNFSISANVNAGTNVRILVDVSTTGGVYFPIPASNNAQPPQSVFTLQASTENLGTFVGQAGVVVSGTLVQSNGTTAIAGASVFARGGQQQVLGGDIVDGTASNGNFAFALPPNTQFTLDVDTATLPSGVAYAKPLTNTNNISSFTSPPSGTQDLGTFQAAVAVTITGTLQKPDGTAIQGVVVTAQNTAQPPQAIASDSDGTNAQGQFQISVPVTTQFQISVSPTGLPEGVTFKQPAVNTQGFKAFTSQSQAGTQNIGTFQGLIAITITGTLKKGDLTALANARVFAQTPGGFGTTPEFLGQDFDGTDSNGVFNFTIGRASGTPPIQFNLFVDTFSLPEGVSFASPAVNDQGTSVFTAQSGTVSTGNFTALVGITVTGRLLRADGQTAVSGGRVFAQTQGSPTSPPQFLGQDFDGTDSNGTFSFTVPRASGTASVSFEIFVDSFSLPAGVSYPSPAVNGQGQKLFSGTSGTVNTGDFLAQVGITVTGKLVKTDGTTPISGARVFAQTPQSPESPPQFLGSDFDGTDANGIFSLSVGRASGAASIQFQIFIDSPSLPQGQSFSSPAANTAGAKTFTATSGTTDTGTFKAAAGVTITGKIADANNSPISGAKVFLQTPGSPESPPQFLGGDFDGTDSSGNFSIPGPASTTFEVFIDSSSTPGSTFSNPAVNTAGAKTFQTGAEGSTDTGTFKAVAAVTITGKVVDAGSTAISGARVFAQTVATGPGQFPQFLGGDFDGTNSSGNFSFSAPASTSFNIFIDAFSTPGVTFDTPAANTANAKTFITGASGTTDTGTFKGKAAVTIIGKVVDASNNAVSGAKVFAQTVPAGPTDFPQFVGGDFDGTDSSGNFSFPGSAGATFQIFIDSFSTPGVTFDNPAVNTAGAKSFTAGAEGTTNTGTFKGKAAVTVTGKVVDAGNNAISGARVFAQTAASGPGSFPQFIGGDFDGTDSSGNFSFPAPASTTFQIFIDDFSVSGVTFDKPAVNTANAKTFITGTSGTTNTGTFKGKAAVTIVGKIVDASNNAVSGAKVFAQTVPTGPTDFPQFVGGDFDGTDSSGNFSFPGSAGATFQIFIDSFSTPGVTFDNPAVNTAGAKSFTAGAEGTTNTGTFKGKASVTVTGKVVDASSNAISGARIFGQTVPTGPGSFPQFIGGDFDGTDSSGNFSFPAPAGTTFQIFIDDFSVSGVTFDKPAVNTANAKIFTTGTEGTTNTGTFKGKASVTIVGTVQTAGGQPIQGARVFAQTVPTGPTDFPQFIGGDFDGTDSNGQFTFPGSAGTTFRIFIDSFSTPGVTFDNPAVNTAGAKTFTAGAEGTTNTGTFKGKASVTVVGTIQTGAGQAIEGARVFAQTPAGPTTPPNFVGGDFDGTDSNGQFSFPAPAEVTFQIFVDPFSTTGVTFDHPAVNTAGAKSFTSGASGTTNTGTFKGKSSVIVTGKVVDTSNNALSGARIFAQTPAAPGSPPNFVGGDFDGTDSNGDFSFPAPAGAAFQIFIDPFSTPGVTFDTPAANTAGTKTFTTGTEGTTNTGTFKGKSSVTVTGTVQTSGGQAISGARVFAQTPASGPETPPQFLGGDFDGTDSSGQFSFPLPASTQFQIFIDATSTPGSAFAAPAVNTAGTKTFTSGASGTTDTGTFKGQSAVTITGTVQTSGGTAIQGATVFAQSVPDPGGFPQFLGGDFDGSDSNGQFSFSVPGSSKFQIFIDPSSTPGSTFGAPAANTAGTKTFTAGTSGTTDTGTFKGQSAITVIGVVQTAAGTAIQGARVFGQTPATDSTPPQFLGGDFDGTDSNGQFSFPAPANTSIQIFIDASGSNVTFSSPAANTAGTSTFTTGTSGTTDTGTFKGTSAVTVVGIIQNAAGTVVAGARVFAQTPKTDSTLPQFLGGDFDGTDSNGQFSFSVAASTQFQIFVDPFSTPGATFGSPATNTAGTKTFTSGASGTTNTGTFKGITAVTAEGIIQNAAGTVIAGARVFAQTVGTTTTPAEFLGGDFDGTDSDGKFSFPVPAGTQFQIFVDPSTTPGFTFAAPAVNTAGTSTFTSGTTGTTSTGTFKGVAAVTVIGVVQNAAGTAVSGAFVFAIDTTTKAVLGGDYKRTQSNGSFSFPVPQGSTFNIIVSPPTGSGLTFASPAVNTAGTSSFTATAPGPVNTGTFKASQ